MRRLTKTGPGKRKTAPKNPAAALNHHPPRNTQGPQILRVPTTRPWGPAICAKTSPHLRLPRAGGGPAKTKMPRGRASLSRGLDPRLRGGDGERAADKDGSGQMQDGAKNSPAAALNHRYPETSKAPQILRVPTTRPWGPAICAKTSPHLRLPRAGGGPAKTKMPRGRASLSRGLDPRLRGGDGERNTDQ